MERDIGADVEELVLHAFDGARISAGSRRRSATPSIEFQLVDDTLRHCCGGSSSRFAIRRRGFVSPASPPRVNLRQKDGLVPSACHVV